MESCFKAVCTKPTNLARDLGAPVEVSIALGEFFTNQDGNIVLTPKMLDDAEIDANISLLIEQLQRAKAEAKALLLIEKMANG